MITHRINNRPYRRGCDLDISREFFGAYRNISWSTISTLYRNFAGGREVVHWVSEKSHPSVLFHVLEGLINEEKASHPCSDVAANRRAGPSKTVA
jgi:hypothetical protein